MSVCRKLADGTVQKIAGHTILLDANASELREGNFTLPATSTGQVNSATITFTDPMPDTDYIVVITGNGIFSEQDLRTQWHVTNKTVTGFTASYYSQLGASVSYHYYAWKPIKLDGYTALQNKVNSPDASPTEDSLNLVTSGGVYEAIKNASAVWKGTKAAWEALPAADKMKYDLAVLLDETLVKAVDREDGTETDVANLNKIFRGTQAQWDALSSTQKDYYDQAEIDEGVAVSSVCLPYGVVQAYAGSNVPAGWLACNGQAVSRSTYAFLFSTIGTTYGSGDGGTTFNVPDYRECALVGIGTNSSDTIADHDEYTLGEFKDDQIQGHEHKENLHGGSGSSVGGSVNSSTNPYITSGIVTDGTHGTPRVGNVTHGKRKGVNYIIFAGV